MIPRFVQNFFRLIAFFAFYRFLRIGHLTPLCSLRLDQHKPRNLSQIILRLVRGSIIFKKFDVRACTLLREQMVDTTDMAQPEFRRSGWQLPSLQNRASRMGHEIIGCV